MEKFIDWLKKRFAGKKVLSSDQGIFDPYVPIGSLTPLETNSLEWEEAFIAEPSDNLPKTTNTFIYFKIFLSLLLVGILFRLVFLQISHGSQYGTAAEGNRLRSELTPAPRGLFFDRNGAPLVTNTPNFSVVFQPGGYPSKKSDQIAYVNKLSPIIGVPVDQLTQKITANLGNGETVLLSGVDRNREMTLQLKLNNFPGVYIQQTAQRQYANVPGLGNILGYIGQATAEDLKRNPNLQRTSLVGQAGLEAEYDDLLQGQPGIETLEVDSTDQIIRTVGSTPPVPGKSLYLTIDSALQAEAMKALQDSLTKNHATSGAAIVTDVNSGDVLAMASLPGFDPNIFGDPSKQSQLEQVLSDPQAPLLNRAIAGQYPSGSTIKPVYAVAALSDGVITKDTKIDTSAGKITVGGTTFSDWTRHGVSSVELAIAQSNDVFFYIVGGGYKNFTGLGVSRIDKWLNAFGFGRATGIDLPGEAPGNVPSPNWFKEVKNEDWYVGDTYNLSIGQGDLLVTPLQLNEAIATIANGGKVITPHLLKSTQDNSGSSVDYRPQVTNNQVAPANNIDTVREGMRLTVTGGSARSILGNLSIPTAAKTGTAQTSASLTNTHAWFTMFAPYDNPQIAVSVVVEGGGEGYDVAGPVARAITQEYFHLPITPINAAPAGG